MLSKLSLLLSVATDTVKRVFFCYAYYKWINNNLIVYIKKAIFNKIDNEIIIKRF